MQQALRHHDQHPPGAFGQQLLVQDQACLDGFAQSHFVGQQHARGVAAGNLVGYVQLVGNQAGTTAREAAQVGMRQAVGVQQGLVAQLECAVRVDLPGEQALCRTVQLQVAVELAFGQRYRVPGVVAAKVDKEPVLIVHATDAERHTCMTADLVTGAEGDPCQRRGLPRIGAGLANGVEQQRDRAWFHAQYRAQAQLQFRMIDPALAGQVVIHRSSPPFKGSPW